MSACRKEVQNNFSQSFLAFLVSSNVEDWPEAWRHHVIANILEEKCPSYLLIRVYFPIPNVLNKMQEMLQKDISCQYSGSVLEDPCLKLTVQLKFAAFKTI